MRALIRRLEVLEKRMGEADEDQLWALRRTHYKQFQPVFVAALDGEITWDVLHEWCQTNPGPDHGREEQGRPERLGDGPAGEVSARRHR